MDHKPVTSQLDRHALLMAMAAAVKKHADDNPYHEPGYEPDEVQYPVTHPLPSSK